MIRQQLHLFNDSAFVQPVYGTTSSSPPPGTLNRAYHRRLKIYADGVFVLPAYDTVGGTPGPATGTMAPRYHRGLSVHAGAWNEAIVLPAYGVLDTPAPPTGQVEQATGGKGDNERRRRTIFKPTGLTGRKREGRRGVEERVRESRELVEEIARGDLTEETPAAEPALLSLSLAERDAEIGRLLRKKIRTDEDEILLLLLVATITVTRG